MIWSLFQFFWGWIKDTNFTHITYIIRMSHLFGGLWGSNWIVSWSRLSRKFLSGKIYRISLISQKLHNTFCKHIPFMCIANTRRSRWISQAIPKIKTFLLNQTLNSYKYLVRTMYNVHTTSQCIRWIHSSCALIAKSINKKNHKLETLLCQARIVKTNQIKTERR